MAICEGWLRTSSVEPMLMIAASWEQALVPGWGSRSGQALTPALRCWVQVSGGGSFATVHHSCQPALLQPLWGMERR